MSNSAVDTVRTIDGIQGLFTFGVRLDGFSGACRTFKAWWRWAGACAGVPGFSSPILDSAMWQTIWTWDLIAFGVSHAIAGLVAAFKFRREKITVVMLLPIIFTGLGLLFSAVVGLITALLIAGIYTSAGFKMTTTEVCGLPMPRAFVFMGFPHSLTLPKSPAPTNAIGSGLGCGSICSLLHHVFFSKLCHLVNDQSLPHQVSGFDGKGGLWSIVNLCCPSPQADKATRQASRQPQRKKPLVVISMGQSRNKTTIMTTKAMM
ncbi:uncharacterized protein MONBRDRAFT_10159 [Monosiga brevicollis MX1]|uniref:Uncharacterized protein n=1 Tax=Monosiga brevicollis TaxID=81824 RepID=A9V5D8_MONBE|nr:uncharacterized protein MONBRDRAFT_10159 [Monosiga brevicollis MX1]EDQ87264.1 predicted protein [Monosiga brevicollis MX1]|eukprot:XP_001747877.1 hypothetical protein [Monosiga brevicollis MX1]